MPAGNDIVAWQHPRCIGKSLDQRFLDKTCLPAEQLAIRQSLHPDEMLWLCWSLKEAAYKLSCFLGNREKFHARRFAVQVPNGQPPVWLPSSTPLTLQTGSLSNGAGVHAAIQWEQNTYHGYSIAAQHYVHSIVTTNEQQLAKVQWGLVQDEYTDKNDFSEAVRGFAMRQLNTQLPPEEQITGFSKDYDGIPFVLLQNGNQQYISLSHDQQWLSFAYIS